MWMEVKNMSKIYRILILFEIIKCLCSDSTFQIFAREFDLMVSFYFTSC